MGWADWTLWAGVFTVLAGLALTLLLVGRRLRGHDRPRGPSAHYVEGVDVLVSQTLLLGGMALTTFGNIAGHIVGNAVPTGPWLSFLGGVGAFLLFGVQLGRLQMRWQVGRLLAEFDTRSKISTTSIG